MCKSYGRIRDIIDERWQSNLHIILSNDEYIIDSHKSNKWKMEKKISIIEKNTIQCKEKNKTNFRYN